MNLSTVNTDIIMMCLGYI